MGESEWVTWESCPRCGERAAVGWSEGERFVDSVEFDCPNGCRPSICEITRAFPARRVADERRRRA